MMKYFAQGNRRKAKQKGLKIGPIGSLITGKEVHPSMAGVQAVGQFFGLDATKNSNSNLIGVPEELGLPSLDTSLRLFDIHLAAIARCKELSKNADISRHCGTLFKVFIDIFGKEYLVLCLEL